MWVKQPEILIPGAVGIHATNQVQVAHGAWAQSHAYAAADLVSEGAGACYISAVAHTSGAGTFAEDRAAHPTYWRVTIWTASAADLVHPATMAWTAALAACEALDYAGFSDWRLPNVIEMVTLINYEENAPATYTSFPNTNTGATSYWTSTTADASTTHAFAVTFGNGVTDAPPPDKALTLLVRPVRGG
jgi:hypothetical protein